VKDHLISPHGGCLVDLFVNNERAAYLKETSRTLISLDLTSRQLCDVELLLNGGFSPLTGFMGKKEYESVCESMRLADGTIWPIPVVLDIPPDIAEKIKPGGKIGLRNEEGVLIAVFTAEDLWKADKRFEAQTVYGSNDTEHPGIGYLMEKTFEWYAGGTVEGIKLPDHYDFCELRYTPAELRAEFLKLGWQKVIGFQTRNPLHRAHFEITLKAARDCEANLLIHPVVGMTKPGDIDHYTRVRCYQALMPYYPKNTASLSLLPLAMRMAGPREAVWHAIIRKNYGCSHFIVGRDHAGPGKNSSGKPFYGPYDAQEILRKYEKELGITMVPFKMMVYVEDMDTYMPEHEVPENMRTLHISGTDLRRRLADGADIPQWFTFPEVAEELRKTHPPRHKSGFTIFFTGLSGAGKSTLARVLQIRLLETGGRPVTLLDGDIVRKNLSSELGFSKEHRDLNIRRIGFVASEITKNGGIAICAPIAPYDKIRKENKKIISAVGGYFLVYVSTPLDVCEKRDRKGLYAKARAGLINEFTGISDPYEEPDDADIIIDTTDVSPEEAVQQIMLHLEREGYISGKR
jgi:sulfate adenylyltransferase